MALFAIAVTPIKVAVIDSGYRDDVKPYLCKDVESRDFTGEGSYDYINHGNVVSNIILSEGGGNVCIVSLKVFNKQKNMNTTDYQEALKYLSTIKVDLVNISMSGSEKLEFEKPFFDKVINSGVGILVAAGNEGKNLDIACDVYPACTESAIFVIGSKLKNQLSKYTNYGKIVKYYEEQKEYNGQSGTSFSVASVSGRLAHKLYNKRNN